MICLGLDAFTAYSLLLTLSRLAKRNRTIILSIHQPRSDAFALFSRIALLSRGHVVYSGLRSRCLSWFATLDMYPQEGTNVLDWLIDVSSVDTRTPEQEGTSRARFDVLTKRWKKDGISWVSTADEKIDDLAEEQDVQVNRLGPIETSHTLDFPLSPGPHNGAKDLQRPGTLQQIRILTRRSILNLAA